MYFCILLDGRRLFGPLTLFAVKCFSLFLLGLAIESKSKSGVFDSFLAGFRDSVLLSEMVKIGSRVYFWPNFGPIELGSFRK